MIMSPEDKPNLGGRTETPVNGGIDHCAVTALDVHHIEATAVHVVSATRPVKLVAAYLSPTRHSMESDVTRLTRWRIPRLGGGRSQCVALGTEI
jgi:hypothetical protein